MSSYIFSFTAQTLIPSRVQSVTDKDISAVYECYEADLQCERQQLDQEVNRWKVRWSLMVADKQLKTLLDAMDACRSAYPLIQLILTELLTMPATSASCERSFSSMKRVKTFIRSTMGEDRLTALAVLHIHRESVVVI